MMTANALSIIVSIYIYIYTHTHTSKSTCPVMQAEHVPYDHAFGALTSGCAPYDPAFGALTVRSLSIAKKFD